MRDEGGEREKVRLGWVRVLRTQEEARIELKLLSQKNKGIGRIVGYR